MAEKTVIIESSKTGEQYGVSVADFRKHYEEQGFKILSHEDGTPYEAPKKPKAPAKASAKAPAKAKAPAAAPVEPAVLPVEPNA
jgi:hypothetical protein